MWLWVGGGVGAAVAGRHAVCTGQGPSSACLCSLLPCTCLQEAVRLFRETSPAGSLLTEGSRDNKKGPKPPEAKLDWFGVEVRAQVGARVAAALVWAARAC